VGGQTIQQNGNKLLVLPSGGVAMVFSDALAQLQVISPYDRTCEAK
jgi:hypothetical protein